MCDVRHPQLSGELEEFRAGGQFLSVAGHCHRQPLGELACPCGMWLRLSAPSSIICTHSSLPCLLRLGEG
eukprot:scaffold75006_cov36-Tisochrysis_lutea.AAC.8